MSTTDCRNHPDHLLPLHGVQGFDMNLDHYKGVSLHHWKLEACDRMFDELFTDHFSSSLADIFPIKE